MLVLQKHKSFVTRKAPTHYTAASHGFSLNVLLQHFIDRDIFIHMTKEDVSHKINVQVLFSSFSKTNVEGPLPTHTKNCGTSFNFGLVCYRQDHQ